MLLDAGLFNVGAGIVGVVIKNINFDAGGTGAADYCIKSSEATSDNWALVDCTFQDALYVAGVSLGGDLWKFTNCEFTGNKDGFFAENNDADQCVFQSCNFHDNNQHGAVLEYGNGTINNCLFTNNGGIGLKVDGAMTNEVISNNTFYGNTGDNISIIATANNVTMTNNTSSGSVGGYGYNFNSGAVFNTFIFKNNHAYDNNAGDADATDITGTLAEFMALGCGSNIGGDPLFDPTTATTTTYIPKSTSPPSPLIDAGVGGTGDTIGALCATAGGGGGVTGVSKARVFGAI